ncbi:MAG: hypothetical protein KVP17_002565 [Porospora cf. gigantea B]|uniref:uncharacterized protein n=1 Tax=Porospora cf. gigantea B TaxID=2853592 RepID=UPI003571B4F7|nr:MAG: hypothetical protein KVP17_002565 [Porospora cf. gigantea B]
MFIPERLISALVARDTYLLEVGVLDAVSAVTRELETILDEALETVNDLKRLPSTRKKILSVGRHTIRSLIPTTEAMVANLLKMERSFINLAHPQLKKNENSLAKMGLLQKSVSVRPLQFSPSDSTVMRVITKDYFSLVKQNLTDSVPKAVHCFLIDASKRSLLPALIQDAYTPSVTAMFEMESAAVTEDHKRHARICQQLLEIEGEISSLTREVHENVV